MSILGKNNPWARLLAGALAVATAVTMVPNTALAAPTSDGEKVTIRYSVKPETSQAFTKGTNTDFKGTATDYEVTYEAVSENGEWNWYLEGDHTTSMNNGEIAVGGKLDAATGWAYVDADGWSTSVSGNSAVVDAFSKISLNDAFDNKDSEGNYNLYAAFRKVASEDDPFRIAYYDNAGNDDTKKMFPLDGGEEKVYTIPDSVDEITLATATTAGIADAGWTFAPHSHVASWALTPGETAASLTKIGQTAIINAVSGNLNETDWDAEKQAYLTGTDEDHPFILKLYAVSDNDAYNIVYDPGKEGSISGNVSTDKKLKWGAGPYTLSGGNVVKRTGYTLAGWTTSEQADDWATAEAIEEASAAGSFFAPGETFSFGETANSNTIAVGEAKDGDDITLYAAWNIDTYTMTFSAGQGYFPIKKDDKVTKSTKELTFDKKWNQTFEFPSAEAEKPLYVPEGYNGETFLGWYLYDAANNYSVDGTKVVATNKTTGNKSYPKAVKEFTENENAKFVAYFSDDAVTVTFDYRNGKTEKGYTTKAADDDVETIQKSFMSNYYAFSTNDRAMDGYTLLGWFRDKDKADEMSARGKTNYKTESATWANRDVPKADVTVYAGLRPDAYKIVYDGRGMAKQESTKDADLTETVEWGGVVPVKDATALFDAAGREFKGWTVSYNNFDRFRGSVDNPYMKVGNEYAVESIVRSAWAVGNGNSVANSANRLYTSFSGNGDKASYTQDVITLIANWGETTVNINYANDGYTLSGNDVKYLPTKGKTDGTTFSDNGYINTFSLNSAVKPGYTFRGWYVEYTTDTECEKAWDADDRPTTNDTKKRTHALKYTAANDSYDLAEFLKKGKDISLYAYFIPNETHIKFEGIYKNISANATFRDPEAQLPGPGNLKIYATASDNDAGWNFVGWAYKGSPIAAGTNNNATYGKGASLSANNYSDVPVKNTYPVGTTVSELIGGLTAAAGKNDATGLANALNGANTDNNAFILVPVYKRSSYQVTLWSDGTKDATSTTIDVATSLRDMLPDDTFAKDGKVLVGWVKGEKTSSTTPLNNAQTEGVTWGSLEGQFEDLKDSSNAVIGKKISMTAVWADSLTIIMNDANGKEVARAKFVAGDAKNATTTIYDALKVSFDFFNDAKPGYKLEAFSKAESTSKIGTSNIKGVTVKDIAGGDTASNFGSGTNRVSEQVFNPVYKAITYKLQYMGGTFSANGHPGDWAYKSAETNVTYDKDVTLATQATATALKRPGYTLMAWNTKNDYTGTKYEVGATVKNLSVSENETVVLYGEYAPTEYTITYDPHDKQFAKVLGKATGSIKGKAATHKVKNSQDANNLTIYAEIPDSGFAADGFEVVAYLFAENANATAAAPATGVYKGTDGVIRLNDKAIELAEKNNNSLTLYPVWAKKSYKITYHANGASGLPEEGKHTYQLSESTTKLSVPTDSAGYTFKGYYYDSAFKKAVEGSGKNYYLPAGMTGDVDVYAKLEANDMTITFYPNGGTGTEYTQTVKYNVTTKLTANKFKSGDKTKVFGGWLVDTAVKGDGTTMFNDGEKIYTSKNLKLYAYWVPEKTEFTATLYTYGGEIANSIVTTAAANKDSYWYVETENSVYESNYIYGGTSTRKLPTAAQVKLTGYTFTGWKERVSGKTYTEIPKNMTGNREFEAQYNANTYTVTLLDNASTISVKPTGKAKTIKVSYQSEQTIACPFKATGYQFLGWATESRPDADTLWGVSSKIYFNEAKDMTYYAQWARIPYTITYMTMGGELTGAGFVEETAGDEYKQSYYLTTQKNISLPAMANRKGYTFEGWYKTYNPDTYKYSGKVKTVKAGVNITVYAKYTASVAVRYHDIVDGGETLQTISSLKKTKLDAFNFKAPDNTIFVGWSMLDTSKNGAGDEKTKVYDDKQQVDFSDIAAAEYTRALGLGEWLKSETDTNGNTTLYLDLYPVFDKDGGSYEVRVFNENGNYVLYHDLGGIPAAGGMAYTTYFTGEGLKAKDLKALGQQLTMNGKTFAYFTDPISGKKITSIGKKAKGNLNLVAQWKGDRKTVTFASVASLNVKKDPKNINKKSATGKTFVVPNMKADGYNLIGWTRNKDFASKVYDLSYVGYDNNGAAVAVYGDVNWGWGIDNNENNKLDRYPVYADAYNGTGSDADEVNEYNEFEWFAENTIGVVAKSMYYPTLKEKIEVSPADDQNIWYAVWAIDAYNVVLNNGEWGYAASLKRVSDGDKSMAVKKSDIYGMYRYNAGAIVETTTGGNVRLSAHTGAQGTKLVEPGALGRSFKNWEYWNGKKYVKTTSKGAWNLIKKGKASNFRAVYKVN